MPPRIYNKNNASSFNIFKKKATVVTGKATQLIIVESPSKCAKIESFLGNDYCCIASKGHVRQIPGLKSIQKSKNYEIKFDICDDKTSQVKMLQETVKKFNKENIFIATDDDREGEAIAWHICQVCELDIFSTKRIVFHEITKPALLKAVANPTKLNMGLVHAQHARQVLDMFVGFRISPLLWKHIPGGKALSAGRCQTPALRLVYDKENDILSNSMKLTYKITGYFTDKRLAFDLSKEIQTEKEVAVFLQESIIFKHELSIHEKRDAYRNAPKPFNTSRLLQHASNQLGMSPTETMSHCQKLYQDGWITYMRTESETYSNEFLQDAGDYIREKWGETYIGNVDKLIMNDSKHPHEAIRVTHIENTVGGEEGRSSKVYKLIWRNTVESCMSDAHCQIVPVSITAPLQMKYKHEIETPLFLGWKIVNEKIDLVDVQNKMQSILLYLQTLNKGTENKGIERCEIKYNEIEARVSVKREHSHYTEASLIQKLEDLGIGRPSTFAMLVNTIQERGYVTCQDIDGTHIKVTEYSLKTNIISCETTEKNIGAEKKKLVLQPIGKNVVEFLLNYFETLFSYSYTENMERDLDEISIANKEWYEICKKCDEDLNIWIKPVNEMTKKEYKICDRDDWVIIFSKYGPLLKEKNKDVSESDSDSEHDTNSESIKIKTIFKPIKKDILLDKRKLLEGHYSWEELIDNSNSCNSSMCENREENGENKNPNILRILTPELSIRKGKFGAYIYYKTPNMKKPQFLNIKKFPLMFTVCETDVLIHWIKTTYNLQI
jgi:DNA topoisomerase-1